MTRLPASRLPVLGLGLALCLGTMSPAQAGADVPWAFRSPLRPALPAVRNSAWVRNPIDAFILARLEQAGLQPAPEADRATLVRRLYFDLIGLPPTPNDLDRALSDDSPDWYEKLVERLLDSPQHGERWALYWLDLVRYAESDGYKADDTRPEAWRYRDYVIRAFNQDKPFDRFLREQLAGDELYPNDADALIATGFLRHYPYEYNAVNLEQKRQDILNDITDTVASVFLGVTLGCAKCHDHKFDPFTQEDYYRIQAFFAAYQPTAAPVGSAEELERYRHEQQQWQERTAALRRQLEELEEPYRTKLAARRMSRFPPEYQQMYLKRPAERSPLEQQIAEMVGKQVQVAAGEVAKSMKPDVRQQWEELGKELAELDRSRPRPLPTAQAMTDIGAVAPPTFLLKRGDWKKPGREVPPGYLSVIDDRPAEIPPPAPGAKTTGRRSVLAGWLTRPDHPLTARVLVNRLWQHHFGRGIVATPSDFGTQGDPPSHPELLDWLACEFTAPASKQTTPWSLKAMHRLMVTSATYRQSCRFDARAAAEDPSNTLWWRMNRRRLEGETLRDAMLAVSGRLNLQQGGPSIFPELPAEMAASARNWTVTANPTERNRRSIYVFVKRNLRYPLFSAFDAPDATETCARRHTSTNAPQALMLLNGQVTLDFARAFADRLLREHGGAATSAALVDDAYRRALGRLPEAAERATAVAFLDRQRQLAGTRDAALADFCHVLLNLNEFIYID